MKCARTVCENTASCRHTQNNAYYCRPCARKINETNPGLVDMSHPDRRDFGSCSPDLRTDPRAVSCKKCERLLYPDELCCLPPLRSRVLTHFIEPGTHLTRCKLSRNDCAKLNEPFTSMQPNLVTCPGCFEITQEMMDALAGLPQAPDEDD